MKKMNKMTNGSRPGSNSGYAETQGKRKGSKKAKQQPENIDKTSDKKK